MPCFCAFLAFAPARLALTFTSCLLARTLPVGKLLVSLHTNDYPISLPFPPPHTKHRQATTLALREGRHPKRRKRGREGARRGRRTNQGRQCFLIEAASRTSLHHRHLNAPTDLATMTRRRSSNAAAVSTTMRQLVVLPWRLLLLACLLPRVTASLRDVSS